MDLLTDLYNWGTSFVRSFYTSSTGGLTGCTPAPAYDATPASSNASDPITLERPELDAIMNMNPGRGNACNMHEMYPGANPDFWGDTARYIIETKFAGNIRNESEHGITAALNQLADNQRAAVIELLATELRNIGDPLEHLNERDYALGCARGIFALLEPFPTMQLNVTYNQLLDMINTARSTVAAAETCTEPRPAVDFPRFFAISAVAPENAAQGEAVTVTIRGDGINFFGQDNALPEGLVVDLGPGIEISDLSRTSDGNLSFRATISSNAARTEREVVIRIAGQQRSAQIGCYSFEVVRGSSAAPAPAPTPPSRPTPRPVAPPAPQPVAPPAPQPAPPPAPQGNPFEL